MPVGRTAERSKGPMLSSPRKPPVNTLSASVSRSPHHVKLSRSLWNMRARKSVSRASTSCPLGRSGSAPGLSPHRAHSFGRTTSRRRVVPAAAEHRHDAREEPVQAIPLRSRCCFAPPATYQSPAARGIGLWVHEHWTYRDRAERLFEAEPWRAKGALLRRRGIRSCRADHLDREWRDPYHGQVIGWLRVVRPATLRALEEASQCKLPALVYAVPYALGNILLIA